MSISSTVKKIMPYIKTASGYVLHRLSSQAVEMDDGTTLEEKVTSLNNLISQKVDTSTVVNNLLTTEAGFVLDARQGKALNDSISDLSSNSYKLHTGLLGGVSTRPYVLKKYNDGTFELCGNLDVSAVRLQYSNSSKVYFTTISAQIPEELTIDLDKRTQFSGSVESEGIYYLSVNELTATTLTVYLSAMNYISEIPYVASGFTLKGWWK